MIETILLLFGIHIISMTIMLFIGRRLHDVLEFRSRVLFKELDLRNGFLIYDAMPSFNKMMMSFKPMKAKYWISEEDITYLELS